MVQARSMGPYEESAINSIYELLFCDDIQLYRSIGSSTDDHPWKELFDPTASTDTLNQILIDPNVETRVKILASRVLSQKGSKDNRRHLFGVIVEVCMEEGLDVVAVYEDGTARYINYSGKMAVWEAVDERSQQLTSDLFMAAKNVISQIGPWDGERLPPPVTGNARLSFLVSDGLYFGEGPFDALAADPMGGAVLNRAAEFMKFLVERTMDQSP